MKRAAAAGLIALAAAAGAPPEPTGYRMDAYRAPTPETLAGAQVVDTAEAEALWREGAAVFIDVMPRPVKPEGLPDRMVWRDPPRDTIPGALWLANAGYGALSAPLADRFAAALAAAGGDRPLVFFCLRDCWMGWNAAKRALALGHEAVRWYPDGTDGWREAGLPLAPARPAAGF